MRRVIARWKYELVAMGVAVIFGVIHCGANPAPVGLAVDSGSPWAVARRGIASLEGRATDVKFKLRGERPANPDVLVVAIDERAIQRFGLWPWPRDLIARGLERLLDDGAAAVGLDLTFTDKTTASQASVTLLRRLDAAGELPPGLERLRSELRAELSRTPDDALEAALRKGGGRVVQGVIPYVEADARDFSPELLALHARLLEPHVLRSVTLAGHEAQLPVERLEMWRQLSVQMPLERFATTGTRFGHFATVTDVDGTIRRSAILAKLVGPMGLFPSMSLETAAVKLDATIAPEITDGVLTGVVLWPRQGETLRIPIEPRTGLMHIDYPGSSRSTPTVSFADVLAGTIDASAIRGKAVLVGVTVTGSSGDQRVTPFRELEPGVFTHAAVLSNVLSGHYLRRGGTLEALEILSMLLLSLGLALLIPRLRAFTAKLGVIIVTVGGWFVVAYLAFLGGTQVAVAVPVTSLVTSAFAVVFLGYLSVDREKLRLRSTFSRYLGEDVMDLAVENPERLNKGEKREMTVLFSDIRGFTSLSERMSPETLAGFINEYLSPMTKIVFDERGTLDKYIGDAVMAFWNAPLDQPDHALRACRAALSMLARLEELKREWRGRGLPELEIGIGINSGPMIVGNMGSDVRVDYTVLGDAVNLASRLEGTTKEYEARIIISEMTLAQVKDHVVARRLGAVRVRGKNVPVRIYELRGLTPVSPADAAVIAEFEAALDAWTARRFEDARAGFERVCATWPLDYPSRRYLAELAAFAASPPPPDWDGVVTLRTK